jgi:hypothetical protein
LIIRESSSGGKVIKNGNRMRLGAFSKFEDFQKKILLFAFVRQCVSKNFTAIHLNRVINYLTKKLMMKNELKMS